MGAYETSGRRESAGHSAKSPRQSRSSHAARAVRGLALAFAALVAALPTVAAAEIINLDFNAFYSEPGSPVVIDSSGQSAVLAEDPTLFINYLSNVPGLGDPTIFAGGAGRSLVFNYEFYEPVGNDDIFHVAILDGATGNVLDPAFEYFLDESSSGQISFDLSAWAGVSLGLQFELIADLLDADATSMLTLSGLHLVIPGEPPVDVPEPGTLSLILVGLAWLGVRRRTQQMRMCGVATFRGG